VSEKDSKMLNCFDKACLGFNLITVSPANNYVSVDGMKKYYLDVIDGCGFTDVYGKGLVRTKDSLYALLIVLFPKMSSAMNLSVVYWPLSQKTDTTLHVEFAQRVMKIDQDEDWKNQCHIAFSDDYTELVRLSLDTIDYEAILQKPLPNVNDFVLVENKKLITNSQLEEVLSVCDDNEYNEIRIMYNEINGMTLEDKAFAKPQTYMFTPAQRNIPLRDWMNIRKFVENSDMKERSKIKLRSFFKLSVPGNDRFLVQTVKPREYLITGNASKYNNVKDLAKIAVYQLKCNKNFGLSTVVDFKFLSSINNIRGFANDNITSTGWEIFKDKIRVQLGLMGK
jgi:hypothetical protein